MKHFILLLIRKIFKYSWVSICSNETFLIEGSQDTKGSFKEILFDKNYKKLKQNLLKDLDKESKIIVLRILSRIKKYFLFHQTIFLNSYDEKINLVKANNIKKSVLRKVDNGYYYGKYFLPRLHFNNEIFFNKYFIEELQTLDKIRNKDIIDVGGFIGDTGIVFSDFTDKNMHIFEPVQNNFDTLQKTIKENNVQNAKLYPFALGDTNKECLINICDSSMVGSTIRDDVTDRILQQEKITITTLDEIVDNNNLQVGLIKVDIEGAEKDFIKGAINTIKSQKPALLFAIYHSGIDFFTIKTILEDLNLGYKFKIRKATKNKVLEDTILLAEVI